MQRVTNVFFHWLPLGATIVALGMCIYIVDQQNLRQGLNDPQIQIAEDGKIALESGKSVADVVDHTQIFDAEKSLSLFVAVYDSNGNTIQSSATIGGELPKPPIGVFESAKKFGENRVTWQPNPSTRIALIIVPVNNGEFVASGRNMREVENRIKIIGNKISLGVEGLIAITFILDLIGDEYRRRVMANAKK